MKRIISIALALLMVITLLPFSVFADDVVDEGTFSKNEEISWKIDSNYTLTISGQGEMPYECPWADYRTAIKAVVIEEGITMALDFEGLTNVKTVSLPESLKSIAFHAFDGCSSLKTIKIPDGVTSFAEGAFAECTALESIELPAMLSKVSTRCFGGCKSLKSVVIPNGATEIGTQAFVNCTGLQSVQIPLSVTKIWIKAFDGCTSLSKVYYAGTKAQWNAMEIMAGGDYGNEPLIKATKVYSSAIPSISVTAGNNAASGKITLKWNAVSGAEKYVIYRATSKSGTYSKLSTTTKLSFTNTSTNPGSYYYYKVKAVDAAGKAIITSDIVYRCCDCAAPVVTASNNAKTGKVVLKWAAVEGAAKYEVYRAASKDGEYVKLTTTSSTGVTNTSAKVNETYYYKVKAISEKTSSANSAFSAIVNRTCDCAAPVVTAGNNATTGKITLKWAAVDGAAKYEIYRSTTKDGTYSRIYTASKCSFTNTSTNAGYTYYYKVKAISAVKSAADSAYSAVVKRVCDCAMMDVSGKLTKNGDVAFSWKAVDKATSYKIYRSGSENGTYNLLKETSSTSYTDTTVKAGVQYYYKFIAVSSKSSSANSSPFIGTALPGPAQPKNFAVDSSKYEYYKLTWSKVDGADGYLVLVGETSDIDSMAVYADVTGTSRKIDRNRSIDTTYHTYYFAVVAYTYIDDSTVVFSVPTAAKKITLQG